MDAKKEELIEIYQKEIQPIVSSKYIPYLTREDITKEEAKKKYMDKFEVEFEKAKQQNPEISRRDYEDVFIKYYGKKPESLITQTNWFLISETKERDVENIHISFGFDEKGEGDTLWAEIALNSVSSIELFLSMTTNEIKELFDLCKTKPPEMMFTFNRKLKKFFRGEVIHETILEKKMCRLTEDYIMSVREKANKINNLKDSLNKPYIGLCRVERIGRKDVADIAEYIKNMLDVLVFITTRKPRTARSATLRKESDEATTKYNRAVEQKEFLKTRIKRTERMYLMGKMKKDLLKAQKELEELDTNLPELKRNKEQKREQLNQIEKDMCVSSGEKI